MVLGPNGIGGPPTSASLMGGTSSTNASLGAGFIPGATPSPTVITGNRAFLNLNGVRVGFCTGVRVSENFTLEPASQIGSIEVREYVPTIADYTINVGMLAIEPNGLGLAGMGVNEVDGLAGTEFTMTIGAALATIPAPQGTGGQSAIVQPDAGTGTVGFTNLVTFTGVVYSGGDIDIQAHRIVAYNASFKARHRTDNGVTPPFD